MNGFIILKLIVMILCCYTQCCVGYNEPCDESNSNPCTTSNEVCSSSDASGTCVCDTGYVYVSSSSSCQQERSLGQTCSAFSQCLAANAECSSGTCQCQSGYHDTLQGIGGTCEKRSLGQSCTADSQCHNTNAGCFSSFCQCTGQGFYQSGTICYNGQLTDPCTTGQCTVFNSQCSSNTCQCRSDYFTSSNTCTKRNLDQTCFTTDQCSTSNAICTGSTQKTCTCLTTHFKDGNSCKEKKDLGESGCLQSVTSCKDPQATCNYESQSYKCRCNSNYYDTTGSADVGGTCTPKVSLGYLCPMADACGTSNAVCGGGTCQCGYDYYDDNSDTNGGNCRTRKSLSTQCTYYSSSINDQCSDPNALCSGGIPGVCNCITGYFRDGRTNTCKPSKALDQSCDPTNTEECSDPNAECLLNPTYKCTCKTSFFKYNSGFGNNCEEVSQLKVTSIIFASVTTSSFTVLWTPPASKSSYVSSYTVTWSPTDNSSSDSSRSVTLTSTTVSTGLTSGQAYRVTITSVNTDTQQGSYRSTSTYKEQAIKPSQAGPLRLSDSNLDAGNNNILLKWTASNGEIYMYSVEILDGSTSFRMYVNTAAAQTSISSADLKHGYTYTINIIARSKRYGTNNAVESSTTYTTTIKTVVKAPGPPTNVQCIEFTDATIKLKWDATSTPNGDRKEYLIKIYEGSNTDLTFSLELLTGNFNTEFIVKKLDSGSYYRFEVFTVNEQFESATGVYTPAPHCATKAQSFTVPQHFKINNIGSRGFTTSWTQPANINTGELFGYVLQIKDGDLCVSEQMYKCSGCIGTSIDILFQNIEQQCDQTVQTTSTKTKAELSGQQTFTTDKLLPYINYTVNVAAVNSEGKGYVDTEYAQTMEEAPKTPTSVVTLDITSTTVLVQWSIDGPRPGVTTYTIMVEPVDTYAPIVTWNVQGFTNTSYNVTGLEEFWTYTVKVKVATSIGEKTSDASSTFKTLPAAPGPVDAFTIATPGGDYTKLKVSWKTPTLLERNGVIKEFKFTHNASELPDSTVELGNPVIFEVSPLDSTVYEKTVVVQPEAIYMFKIYPVNADNQPGYVTSEIKIAPAGVPKNDFEDVENKKVIPINKVVILGHTSFRMVINRPYIEQTTYGAIVLSGIIMCTDCTSLTGKDSIKLDAFKTYPNYNAATGNGGPYRPTKDSWVTDQASIIGRLKTTADDEIEYTVGVDVCTNTVDYCNGPLKPDTSYSVQVVVCTNGGCLLSNLYGPFKTEAETSTAEIPSTIIIISVMGAVILVLVVAFVISFVHHRRVTGKPNGSHSNDHTSKVQGSATFENLQPDTSPSSENDVNNYMELDEACRHSNTYDRINNDRKTLRRERGRHMRHERI